MCYLVTAYDILLKAASPNAGVLIHKTWTRRNSKVLVLQCSHSTVHSCSYYFKHRKEKYVRRLLCWPNYLTHGCTHMFLRCSCHQLSLVMASLSYSSVQELECHSPFLPATADRPTSCRHCSAHTMQHSSIRSNSTKKPEGDGDNQEEGTALIL